MPSEMSKIIIRKAQGVSHYNNAAHPKHQKYEETSPNRNHIIASKQYQTLKKCYGDSEKFVFHSLLLFRSRASCTVLQEIALK